MRADFPLPDVTWPPSAEFWAGAARGELVLPQCVQCQRLCWYPKRTCRRCGHDGFRWGSVAGEGRLFSWTVVRHPFLAQFAGLLPYVSGLVALDADPTVRLVTMIVDSAPEDLAVDMPMEVVFRPLSFTGVDGSVTGPCFRPSSRR